MRLVLAKIYFLLSWLFSNWRRLLFCIFGSIAALQFLAAKKSFFTENEKLVNQLVVQYFDQEIDLVYTWVNGSDPLYIEERAKYTSQENPDAFNNRKNRYTEHNELLYSLRSVASFAPWIRYYCSHLGISTF
jgi:hypothetical protein